MPALTHAVPCVPSRLESLPNEILHLIIDFLPSHCYWRFALANSKLKSRLVPLLFGSSKLGRRDELVQMVAQFSYNYMLTTALSFGPVKTTLTTSTVIRCYYYYARGRRRPVGFASLAEDTLPASTLNMALTNGLGAQSIPVIRTLLAAGADDCTSRFWLNKYCMEYHIALAERTPLHVVDNIRALAVLLEPGSNCLRYLNTVSFTRWPTPLATAIASHRSFEFVKMLIDAGADASGPHPNYATDQELIDVYDEEGVEYDTRFKGTLERAFGGHWLSGVPGDEYWLTHFEIACLFGRFQTAELLLRSGASIFECTRYNGPLHALETGIRATNASGDGRRGIAFVDLFMRNGLETFFNSPLIMGTQWFVSEAVFMRFLTWGVNPMVSYLDQHGITSLARYLVTVQTIFGPDYITIAERTRLRCIKANALLACAMTAGDAEGFCRQWAISEGLLILRWGFEAGFHSSQRRSGAILAVNGMVELFEQDLDHIPIWRKLFFENREDCPYIDTLHICRRVGGAFSSRARVPVCPILWSIVIPDVDAEDIRAILNWRTVALMTPFTYDNFSGQGYRHMEVKRDDNMVRIIRTLLRAGVPVDAVDNRGQTLRDYALRTGWGEVWQRALECEGLHEDAQGDGMQDIGMQSDDMQNDSMGSDST
ncbi:predicted protein [Verticillium alfalfae VaMs.102]|uniref:Predicted protein n=1 Tax=Verticillium alfalfae (strain VaMs.102 / ATCC MYA-4576 / FGSC 10136) TaxID=526221 RepID=C9SW72_VERA1|nr:predicted protein [Verticillium alfalfae VaMs.102]EEY23037.1 predicted protein [Verticillium alfalfae VaMs.102]